MLARMLKKGDTIGLVSPCNLIDDDDIEVIENSKKLFEENGFKIKFGKNCFKNTTGYGATAKEKAEDINAMYADNEVKAIMTVKGGYNSNTVYDYLDIDLIKQNNKIICGYSDAVSYINYIVEKTGNIGFIGPNFKTVTSSETSYCFEQLIKHFCEGDKTLITKDDECYMVERVSQSTNTQSLVEKENEDKNNEIQYITEKRNITVEGQLIGGNLYLISELSDRLNFDNKILFIEDFAYESNPQTVSNHLYNLKQKKVFDKIKGLWIGNYESDISMEKIVLDTIDTKIPIIKSNNFGHIEKIMTIPLGVKARITDNHIEIAENYLNKNF